VKGEENTPIQLCPVKRANLNHWTTPVRFTELFSTGDQANSAGDDKKVCNIRCDIARTCEELG
jgi:predicted transposase YbfD/YdcC